MSPKKEPPQQQFKLNYFDIIKGVLFPQIGKPKPTPKPATPPAAATATPPAQANPTPVPAVAPAKAQEKTPAAEKKPATDPEVREKRLRTVWTIGSIASIVVNALLILIIIILVNQLFILKSLVGDQLLGGLYENFILMDQASIKTTITVEDEIPINFDLPINQETEVTLTQDTRISGAYVSVLNVPVNIVLPAGTRLPIMLNMTVPVSANIPVKLNVPVNIPLKETELHEPFTGLQNVVSPYYWMLQPDWKSCKDSPVPNLFCFFFATP